VRGRERWKRERERDRGGQVSSETLKLLSASHVF